jgi:gas vesicle protein
MSDNSYGGGHLLAAFLAGAAAGAVTALLLAPKSGAETREAIKGYVKEGADKVSEKVKAVVHRAPAAVPAQTGEG